ncbi:iron ABC transporter substrate-binding protein [Saccharothrix algeriensis]|uniref:Iron ABC transporter substrate-binding protein n=1 Tax=Catellatospora bangladeshensis TaxID=310355 RepID=A0A8J3NKI8_9ACTN|nr:iron ABC transporter substrate-binding protein [Catellatospora bangladeshensis]
MRTNLRRSTASTIGNGAPRKAAPRTGTAAFLAAAVFLAAGLTACSGSEPKDVTVYSGRTQTLVQPLIDEFTKKTGITVDVRYGTTAQMAAQLQEEGDKSPADVFLSQDAGALGAVAKAGLLAQLPAELLAKVPAPYQHTGGQWVGVTGRLRVFAYNADQVKPAELPKSVLDVTGPQWKGRLGVAPTNASFQTFVTAMRVQHGDAKAKEFLGAIKANEPQIRDNNIVIVGEINDGKLAAGLVNHYYLFEKAAELGVSPDQLKVKLHYFGDGDTGGLLNVSGLGLLKKATGNDKARQFMDYLLGADGQTYFATKTFEYPLIAGVPAAPGLPVLADLKIPPIDLNDLDTLAASVGMIKSSGLTS